MAVRLLAAATAAIDRYSNLPVAEAKLRLIADGRALDSDGLGAIFTDERLPDFLFITDMRSPTEYGSFTMVLGRNRYGGLSLVLGKGGHWIAKISDGLRGPAKETAVKLAKALEREGALYVDWDASLGRRPLR